MHIFIEKIICINIICIVGENSCILDYFYNLYRQCKRHLVNYVLDIEIFLYFILRNLKIYLLCKYIGLTLCPFDYRNIERYLKNGVLKSIVCAIKHVIFSFVGYTLRELFGIFPLLSNFCRKVTYFVS